MCKISFGDRCLPKKGKKKEEKGQIKENKKVRMSLSESCLLFNHFSSFFLLIIFSKKDKLYFTSRRNLWTSVISFSFGFLSFCQRCCLFLSLFFFVNAAGSLSLSLSLCPSQFPSLTLSILLSFSVSVFFCYGEAH